MMKKLMKATNVSAILMLIGSLVIGCASANATMLDGSGSASASGSLEGNAMADSKGVSDSTGADSSVDSVRVAREVSAAANTTSNSVSAAVLNTNAVIDQTKDKDLDSAWSLSESTQIALTGSGAVITGEGASVSGGTITISQTGTYVVRGTLSKGQILVDAAETDDVRIVLNGVDITADTNTALYAAGADKVVLILADGTQNTLTDNGIYAYADTEKEEPDAALFSKCDLSINGSGTLTVNGNFKHGIATKDDLVIAGGGITVNAVSTAIRGKDSVTILDGTFLLHASNGDGIKTANDTDEGKGWIYVKDGTFHITAHNDGIQAATQLRIDGGTIEVSTGGGWPGGSLEMGSHARTAEGVVSATLPDTESYKGLKGSGSLVVNGGEFTLSSYDDAIHSNGSITINSGTLTAQSGEDGIHADGTVIVNGGKINIKNSYEGIEGASISLNGGTVSVRSTDDGVNMNGQGGILTISGGEIYVDAGGDGMDSNGGLEMTGGVAYIDGPTASDDTALDIQNQLNIHGGTLAAVSLMGGDMLNSSSEQPFVRLHFTSTQKAGTEISLKSADGATVVSHTPQKDFSSVLISAPGLALNETYTFYADGVKLTDVTLSAAITQIDETGAAVSGGGMGGGRGGMGGGKRDGMIRPPEGIDGMPPDMKLRDSIS